MSNTFISSSPYQCFPNTFQNFIILNGGNNITLPDYNKQTNIITFANTSSSTVTINSFSNNSPVTLTLLTQQQVSFTPEKSYGYYVTSFSSGSNPNFGWKTTGNSNLGNLGALGTTDSLDTWKIVEGGNTVMNLINQGEINIPNVNVLSFGNRGGAQSTLILKQALATSTTPITGPASGMQMISATDNNSFYWGIDSSDNFTLYSFLSGPNTYNKLMSFNNPNSTAVLYLPLSMSNQNITNVANPNNPQDAATKNYVDNSCMSQLIPALGSENNTTISFNCSTIGGGANSNFPFNNNNSFWSTGPTTTSLTLDANFGQQIYFGAFAISQTGTGPGAGSQMTINVRVNGVNTTTMYSGNFVSGYFKMQTPAIGTGVRIVFANTVGSTNLNFMQYYGHYL